MAPPIPLAMIVCDLVWRDPTSQKFAILGVFSMLRADEFPLVYPRIAVYTVLTEVRGKVPLLLRVVDTNEEFETVGEVRTEIESNDPIANFEIIVNLNSVTFPEPGEYRVQLYAGKHFLVERRVNIEASDSDTEVDG
jgi:hypothetical protein